MNKKEIRQRVLQNGKSLDLDKFEWDEKANVFSTVEDNLVLDFKNLSDCIFNTGCGCTFDTAWNCTFKTGSDCTFKTGSDCIFNTGSDCIFNTGSDCTFNTGSDCTFNTTWGCTFKTGSYCTFKTGWDCTFDTDVNCVVVRRDIYQVIELEKGKKIKLNGFGVLGFTFIEEKKEVFLSGKEITVTVDGVSYVAVIK